MDFLKPAKFFFALSAILTLISIVLFIVPGPILSIEFTGGTRMELRVEDESKTRADVVEAVDAFDRDLSPVVNSGEDRRFLIRMRGIDNDQHQALLTHLTQTLGDVQELSFTTIGPTVGSSLQSRAIYALIIASLGIILYIAFVFRKIPRKYSPWKFGVVAVVTLLHDIMITVGVFTILSWYTSFEVDTLFVTALLTILGYSVNDTIIVFDRIRDNLIDDLHKHSFAELSNQAVNQTWKRSFFTSFSTLIVLFALFFLGSSSIMWFVLTLIIGIALGTYSSIFVAMPLLVLWSEQKRR